MVGLNVKCAVGRERGLKAVLLHEGKEGGKRGQVSPVACQSVGRKG